MKPTKPLAELRKLLFNIPDIYSDWYFYTKEKLQTTGLIVHASNIDLSDAELLPIPASKYPDILIHIKVQKLEVKDVDDPYANSIGFPKETFIRAFFHSIVLFPGDILKVESLGHNEYKVFLLKEDEVYRPKVEASFLNPEIIKGELITRINLNLRTQNVKSIKRLLECYEFRVPPGLNDNQTWNWVNDQDPQTVWNQFDDLQMLYDFNLAILERDDIYHLCMVDAYKDEIIDYTNYLNNK